MMAFIRDNNQSTERVALSRNEKGGNESPMALFFGGIPGFGRRAVLLYFHAMPWRLSKK
jgi:hypothetical protein